MTSDATPLPGDQNHDEQYLPVLRAVMDRIIPPDDFPGAWDAGVGDYIERQLAGDLQHLAPFLRAGLAAIDAEAECRFAAAFTTLVPEDQDFLLERIEAGDARTPWPIEPEEIFGLLVRLTNEGYYADPSNGGNREEIAWRMIGYQTRIPHGDPL